MIFVQYSWSVLGAGEAAALHLASALESTAPSQLLGHGQFGVLLSFDPSALLNQDQSPVWALSLAFFLGFLSF